MKYSLRRCQSPEEAMLNVFRYHWDCRIPRALLLKLEGKSACLHASVCVHVFGFRTRWYSCVIVCMGLITHRSAEHHLPAQCSRVQELDVRDTFVAHWETQTQIETPVYCLTICTISWWAAAWIEGISDRRWLGLFSIVCRWFNGFDDTYIHSIIVILWWTERFRSFKGRFVRNTFVNLVSTYSILIQSLSCIMVHLTSICHFSE